MNDSVVVMREFYKNPKSHIRTGICVSLCLYISSLAHSAFKNPTITKNHPFCEQGNIGSLRVAMSCMETKFGNTYSVAALVKVPR